MADPYGSLGDGGDEPQSFEYPFECQFCEVTFKTIQAYTEHMRRHETLDVDKEYRCLKCNRIFVCPEELQLHLRVLHQAIKPYKCKLCDQQFSYARNLEYHLQSHGGVKLFQCQLCDASLLHLQDLNEHLKDHQMGHIPATEPMTEGDLMPDIAPPPALRMAHEDSVKEEDELDNALPASGATRLPPTNNTTTTATTLSSKLTSGPVKQRFIGDSEEAEYSFAVNLKRLICNLCNKKMANRKSLNTHYKNVHKKNKHKCPTCQTSFLFQRLLDVHLRKRKRVIKCQHCDVLFCSNKPYQSHLARRHADERPEGSPAIKATTLGHTNGSGGGAGGVAGAANTIARDQQMLLMMGKFPCNDCGKIFLSQPFLQAHHEKRRNSNFAYECDECGHRFAKAAILEEHRAYHKKMAAQNSAAAAKRSAIVDSMTTQSRRSLPLAPAVANNSAAAGQKGRMSNGNADSGKKSRYVGVLDTDEVIDYESHIIRISESSFKCRFCQRLFKAINHLKCHLRFTHLQKTFQCRQCSTQFAFYKLYLSHARDYRSCAICHEKLCPKTDYLTHLRTCSSKAGGSKHRLGGGGGGGASKPIPPLIELGRGGGGDRMANGVEDDVDEDDDDMDDGGGGGGEDEEPLNEDDMIEEIEEPVDEGASMWMHQNSAQLMAADMDSDYPSIPAFLMDDVEPTEYKCELCDKVFGKITSLHLHSFSHYPDKEMKCMFCNFLFLQRSSLNRHYRCRNTIHTCKTCNESFCSNLNLRQHTCMGSDGDEPVGGANLSHDEDLFTFPSRHNGSFDAAFTSPPQKARPLKRHTDVGVSRLPTGSVPKQRRLEEEDSIELSDTETGDDDMDQQVCMICQERFGNKVELDQHVQRKHGAETKCNICFKTFRSPIILQIHMTARASLKNHISCPKCPHRFCKQGDFRQHFLYHTLKASRPHDSDEMIYARIAMKLSKGN